MRMIGMFGCFRAEVTIHNGHFITNVNANSGWTHVVMNYIGPSNGQGIRVFMDGREVASSSTKMSRGGGAGDGKIVVGKLFTVVEFYSSLQVDELIFFDQALNLDEIRALYNVM